MNTTQSEKLVCVMNTPVGQVEVQIHNGAVQHIEFLPQKKKSGVTATQGDSKAKEQINRYFCNPNTSFRLRTEEHGTAFQKRVWQALREIPVGETRTYGQIAKQLNSSPRAVGNACRANPLPIITPCHRVVAVNGPGGFAGTRHGKWMKIKKWLLAHEAGLD